MLIKALYQNMNSLVLTQITPSNILPTLTDTWRGSCSSVSVHHSPTADRNQCWGFLQWRYTGLQTHRRKSVCPGSLNRESETWINNCKPVLCGASGSRRVHSPNFQREYMMLRVYNTLPWSVCSCRVILYQKLSLVWVSWVVICLRSWGSGKCNMHNYCWRHCSLLLKDVCTI